MVGERTSTPEEGPAVGAVSVATQVAAGTTDVVQQLAGASIRKFSDPLPVSTTARPFEIGQAGHGAMPTQQLEELCVATMAGGVLDPGDGVGVCHVAAR